MIISCCPGCGNNNVEFIGYSDGAGDYGDELGEDWECPGCGMIFTPRTWSLETDWEMDQSDGSEES
jgi:hypothetical protein